MESSGYGIGTGGRRPRASMRERLAAVCGRRGVGLAIGVALALVALLLLVRLSADDSPAPTTAGKAGGVPDNPAEPSQPSRARAVQITGAGSASAIPPVAAAGEQGDASRPNSTPVSAREVRSELASFKQHLAGVGLTYGPKAKILPNGTAVAPRNAPAVVAQVIAAGNEIAKTPYRWGGGHGAFKDSGYDCSGSVSFALAGAGLLDRPMASTGFYRWGDPGAGKWITIYTNSGHMFMVVAGLRFDTSGQGRAGTRWQPAPRSTGGYQARHYPGL